MTDSLMLKTLDFTTAYFGVLLGQCALISFFLFPLIFLLREILFKKNIFLKKQTKTGKIIDFELESIYD